MPATDIPETFPLNPERPRKPPVWPQSHVACNRDLHEVVKAEPPGRDQNEGPKAVRAQKCAQCAPPFGRTNTRWAPSSGLSEGSYSKKILQEICLGHVVTTTLDHERVKANNWPTETARRETT